MELYLQTHKKAGNEVLEGCCCTSLRQCRCTHTDSDLVTEYITIDVHTSLHLLRPCNCAGVRTNSVELQQASRQDFPVEEPFKRKAAQSEKAMLVFASVVHHNTDF